MFVFLKNVFPLQVRLLKNSYEEDNDHSSQPLALGFYSGRHYAKNFDWECYPK